MHYRENTENRTRCNIGGELNKDLSSTVSCETVCESSRVYPTSLVQRKLLLNL